MNAHRTVITEAQHFNVVARHMHVRTGRSGVYAKPDETQAKAMKRILAASRRVKSADARSFPVYKPGMSTAKYVEQYHNLNRSLITEGFFGDLNTEPAALYENGAFDFAPIMETITDEAPADLVQSAAEVCEPAELAEVCEPAPSEPAEVSTPIEAPDLVFVSRYSGQKCDGLSEKSAQIEASKRASREPEFTFKVARYTGHCVPSGRFCVERWQPVADPGASPDHWMPRPSIYRTHCKTAELARTLYPAGTWNDGSAPWFLRDKREKSRPDVRAMRDAIAAAVRQARKPAEMVGPMPESADAYFARMAAKTDARKALAVTLAASADTVQLFHKSGDGRFAIAGPDMSNAGSYRVSWFDSRGPFGHMEFRTLADAIEQALTLNYKPAEHAGDDAPAETRERPAADAAPACPARDDARPGPAPGVGYRCVSPVEQLAGRTPTPLSRPVAIVGQFDPIHEAEARARLTAAGFTIARAAAGCAAPGWPAAAADPMRCAGPAGPPLRRPLPSVRLAA